MEKTNVMRLLDAAKIPYGSYEYAAPDGALSGVEVARQLGLEEERVFKTLVTQAASGKYYVFVIPIAEEVQLKTAAKAVGEKSVEMIHVKDITKITGYVRGGCSPLGMKKQFRTVIDKSAENFEQIYVSGGRIGSTIKVSPTALARVVRAGFAAIAG